MAQASLFYGSFICGHWSCQLTVRFICAFSYFCFFSWKMDVAKNRKFYCWYLRGCVGHRPNSCLFKGINWRSLPNQVFRAWNYHRKHLRVSCCSWRLLAIRCERSPKNSRAGNKQRAISNKQHNAGWPMEFTTRGITRQTKCTLQCRFLHIRRSMIFSVRDFRDLTFLSTFTDALSKRVNLLCSCLFVSEKVMITVEFD